MVNHFNQWHLATLNAWIRNEGAHKTKAKGFHDWNSELIEPVAKDMTVIWWSYDHAIEEASEKCYTSLSALLEGIREILKSMSSCVKSVEWKIITKPQYSHARCCDHANDSISEIPCAQENQAAIVRRRLLG